MIDAPGFAPGLELDHERTTPHASTFEINRMVRTSNGSSSPNTGSIPDRSGRLSVDLYWYRIEKL
jgi:hypothetical protein